MPYGQKKEKECISIDINALRAKEKKNVKKFLNHAINYYKINLKSNLTKRIINQFFQTTFV